MGGAASFDSRAAYRWWVLALLTFVYVLNFLDRQLLSILANPIQEELHLTDGQLGLLGGLYFALFYCTVSIPVAWLADRANRVWVLCAACALWSAATAACGLSHGYPQLSAARMAVGIGEAGGAPPSFSLISDYFPPEQRGRALAVFSLGVPLGQALGVAFGAKLAASVNWRAPFMVLGAVGIATAAVVALCVRERPRGSLDAGGAHTAAAVGTSPGTLSLGATLRAFFQTRVLCLTALAAGLGTLINYGSLSFVVLFLMREKGMTFTQIASYYSVVLGVAMGTGGYASGWLVDRFGPRRPAAYAIVPGAALAIAAPFFFAFVRAPAWQVALPLLAVPLFLNIFYLAPALAVVQNSVAPHRRTLSSAMFLLLVNLIGLGLGPTYVGAMSDHFKVAHPQHALQFALYALIPFYVAVTIVYGFLARALRARAAG